MNNLKEVHPVFMLEKVGAIVAAYVSRNAVEAAELPSLIDQVPTAIADLRDRAGQGGARSDERRANRQVGHHPTGGVADRPATLRTARLAR